MQIGDAFDFWQHDPVQRITHHGADIAVAEWRVVGVDPHIRGGVAGHVQGGAHQIACGDFFNERDGILQIKDHRVGIQAQRLFDTPRVVAGRK